MKYGLTCLTSQLKNRFEISHSSRNHHCHALSYSERFYDWNGCPGRRTFSDIWVQEEFRNPVLRQLPVCQVRLCVVLANGFHDSGLTPSWVSNYMLSYAWFIIIYPSPNFFTFVYGYIISSQTWKWMYKKLKHWDWMANILQITFSRPFCSNECLIQMSLMFILKSQFDNRLPMWRH